MKPKSNIDRLGVLAKKFQTNQLTAVEVARVSNAFRKKKKKKKVRG